MFLFCCLLKCVYVSLIKSVDPEQTAPVGAVCSGLTLFASTYIIQ